MLHEWEELDDELAAGSICPIPECGALVIAFRATCFARRCHTELWEFTCGRCGFEFEMSENELVLQSVPKGWLFAKVHPA
jgi:hypothetical protein